MPRLALSSFASFISLWIGSCDYSAFEQLWPDVLEKLGAGTSVQIKRSGDDASLSKPQLLPSQSYGRNSHEREEQNTENSAPDEQDFQDNSTGPTPRVKHKTEAKVSSRLQNLYKLTLTTRALILSFAALGTQPPPGRNLSFGAD